MTTHTYELDGAKFYYRVNDDGTATITDYSGHKQSLVIPETIEGHTVTGIYKKAFFNKRHLFDVTLPATLQSIGDWAFSYCGDLAEVTMPAGAYEMGRQVFLACPKLREIILVTPSESTEKNKTETRDRTAPHNQAHSITTTDDTTGIPSLSATIASSQQHNTDISRLLAASTQPFSDGDTPLFTTDIPDAAGWLALFDAALIRHLAEPDAEGFTKLLLCGEEDYGSKENNLDYFVESKRKRKVKLAMLRLLQDKELAQDNRDTLTAYLLAHTAGQASEETFLVLKEDFAEDVAYIDLFLSLGCATHDNIDGMLTRLAGEEAQLKAKLISHKEATMSEKDFFAEFSL